MNLIKYFLPQLRLLSYGDCSTDFRNRSIGWFVYHAKLSVFTGVNAFNEIR